MSDFLDKCRSYGADVEGAMERFMDDEELYLSCIEIFTEDEGFAGLGQSLEKKDYKTAFDQAHTLKGVAGNLGLTPLFDALCNIVEPLRSDEYDNLDALYDVIKSEKERLDELV